MRGSFVMQLNPNILKLIEKACKGKKHIKLTVGFIYDGKTIIKVFDENGEIQNGNFIYEIASITKVFTASLLSKYVYENKLSLDDSIQKYFNGLDSNTYYPTLKRLATHTAGYSMALPFTLSEYLATPFKGFPALPNVDKIQHVLEKNKRQNRDYSWRYSNFGFMLLGHAIGVASGKGYWNAMDEFLSNELFLQNTYTGTCTGKNLHGFNNKNEDCGNVEYNRIPEYPSGEGDMSSTAEDLLKFAQLNMHEERPYLSFCHKKQVVVSPYLFTMILSKMGVKKFDMGLGWWLDRKNNNIIQHGGDSDSFSSCLLIDKEKKVASVVLSNYKMDVIKIGLSVLANLQR